MNLTIEIAEKIINITFLEVANKVVPLFNRFFRDFISPKVTHGSGISISTLKSVKEDLPDWIADWDHTIEQKVAIRDVSKWIEKSDNYKEDFSIKNDTIATFCLGGLLLFDPANSAGRIYLLKDGPECFMPLLRLFWIYFAQVLGEFKSCFIHSAALIKDGKGYMFLGDSGAGKSSLAAANKESIVLSDDSPVFNRQDGDYLVFPSPYHQIDPLQGLEKDALGTRTKVEGIYFLTKDKHLDREKVPRQSAVSMIMNRYLLFFSYLSREAKTDIFDLVLGAVDQVPVYNLHFSLDHDIWKVVLDE